MCRFGGGDPGQSVQVVLVPFNQMSIQPSVQPVCGKNTSCRNWYYRDIEVKAWKALEDWPWVDKAGLARFYANLDTKTNQDWADEFLGNLHRNPDDTVFTTNVHGVHVQVDIDVYNRNAYGFTGQGASSWVDARQ